MSTPCRKTSYRGFNGHNDEMARYLDASDDFIFEVFAHRLHPPEVVPGTYSFHGNGKRMWHGNYRRGLLGLLMSAKCNPAKRI